MRLRLGRPDLAAYARRFDVPAADAAGLSATFLGVSTILLDDGGSALMTDGYFSRPGLLKVGLGTIAPDEARIEACLERVLGGRGLEAVIPVHTHFDHALDSAVVAQRTGARLLGGTSTANLGRGGRLPEDRITVVEPGAPQVLGPWTVTMTPSHHCPPDRYPGEITAPVVPPATTSAYRCGEAWSVLVAHASGRTALIQGSAGYVAGALAGQQAEVVYLGVGQLGLQDEAYITAYWAETVRTVGARRVVLTHWDDFFSPLPMAPGDRGLRALPYAGDDLGATLRVLDRRAAEDGVSLSFPTVWQREDPWA
ncbi:MAG TPA: MBL fold metallo-hydrolase [Actinomycetes bacterium]|jgi:L-ascorbate metabolism protein UlaG (beta-lactamase superfamily)